MRLGKFKGLESMINIEQIDGVLRRERVSYDVFHCEPTMLESICFNVKSQLGYIWLKDIIAIETKEGFELRYLFYFLESNYKFTLVLNISNDFVVKSIAHIWLNALYMEQELHEMFGVKLSRMYNNLIFSTLNTVFPMLNEQVESPKPKKFDRLNSEALFENSPTGSMLRFTNNWEDNLISKSTIVSGLFHSGLEKVLEGTSVLESINSLENFFSHRGSLWSMSLIKSIEKANHIKIPDRAMALRMITQEFIRILEHLYFLRNIHIEMKHPEGFMNFIVYIKTIHSLMISFSGNEYLHGVNRVGGVLKDVDQVWMSRAMDELDRLERKLQVDFQANLLGGRIDKSLDFPLLDKTLAYSKCLSGPVARSVGLNLDLRKSNPEYFYGDVDFDVPIGTSGSAFDLYSVKFQEILQSINIIIQVLDNLPTGFISTAGELDLITQKNKKQQFNDSDYLKAFEQLKISPDADGSSFFEGPNGHLGTTCIIDNNSVSRLKLFSNDFLLKNIFSRVSTGKVLDELRLSWVSLGVDMKSVER